MTQLLEKPVPTIGFEDGADRKYTIEDFEALPDDGKEYELLDGELVEMKGASGRHAEVITALGTMMRTHIKANQLGRIFIDGPVALTENYVPRPDIVFVAAGKLPARFDGPIPAIPDLVVEVNSPTDTTQGIYDKLVRYREAGVRLVWSVFLLDEYVLVHHLDSPKLQVLNLDDELEGEDVIPGFKLKVSTIFEQ